MHTIVGRVALAGIQSVLYFPVWWYTRGFMRYIRALGRSLGVVNETLGVTIWIRNIFVPLYGQTDIAGRSMSFLIRCANIFARGAVFVIVAAGYAVIGVLWLVLPVLIIMQYQAHA